MQYVNDDMDDVFRRAAENYPLDTSGADWNRVLEGLNGQPRVKPEKKRGPRQFLWLIMLLPIGLVCNYYHNNNGSAGKVDQLAGENNKKENSQNSTVTIEQPATGLIPNSGNGDLATSANKIAVNKVSQAGSLSENKKILINEKNKKKSTENSFYIRNQSATAGENDVIHNKRDNGNEARRLNSTTGPEIDDDQASAYTGFIDPRKIQLGAVSIQPSTDFSGVPNKPMEKQGLERNPKKFYLGLMAGINKTTIESQKTTDAGYDYGMLLGYKIGSKWAVEAGAFMDKKYYYTQGKYFKKDGIYMPPNSWITDVEGSCRMWDLSIGGSYSLFQNKKSGLFLATGMSSYIMKEEDYDYTYYYAGSGTSAVHSKTYYNESKDLFSIINLSMGYTHRLGKISDLRVEPYMKIPVQGVGVGNLSLFSAGVHIGLTGKLF